MSVQRKRLELSEQIFGLPNVAYEVMTGRTLEDRTFGVANAPADQLTISADGHRLDFELNVNVRSDHIRLLVDHSADRGQR